MGCRDVQQAEQELREAQAKAVSAILAARQSTALLKVSVQAPPRNVMGFPLTMANAVSMKGWECHHGKVRLTLAGSNPGSSLGLSLDC